MEEIDKFFAEVNHKYQQKPQLSTNSNKSSNPSFSTTNNNNSGGQLDDCLGKIMDDFQEKKADQQSNHQDLFQEIKGNFPSKNLKENQFSDDLFRDLIPQENSINNEKSQAKNHKLDDVFADVQAKFVGQKSQKQTPKLDDTKLNEIQSQYQQKKVQTNNRLNTNQAEDIFADVQAKFVGQKNQKQAPKLDDTKLTEIQSQYQQKKGQTQVTKPLDIEAIKKEELNKQRRRKALVKQAEQWLNKLDPYSDEGFWFQQFAESYESKLEAAIDYLDVLNRNK